MFFTSWELWEQMTFVLGCAIAGVFVIGYVKLLWQNRLVRRQELVDEEKRSRIQELRRSGQIVESQQAHDIPFGVRAIQSGIQVDGIWISNTNTPAPSERGLDMSAPEDSSGSHRHSRDNSQKPERSQSRQAQSPLRNDYTHSTHLLDNDSYERNDPGAARPSYKPRKSSQLRYGSPGETKFHDETLAQLEGQSSAKRKIYTHRPRGSRQVDLEGDSEHAADNEHSSGGSSDSEATLSGGLGAHADRQNKYSPMRSQAQYRASPAVAAKAPIRPSRDSFPFPSTKSEYVQVPLADSPNYEREDPFLTPRASPPTDSYPAGSIGGQLLTSSITPSQYQQVQQSSDHSPERFVPGELHINRQNRKINSGFEVLPAGTFGTPTVSTQETYNSHEHDFGERRQSKLQKKPRTSGAFNRT